MNIYRPPNIEQKIKQLVINYNIQLNTRIKERIEEMKLDDKSHFLIYNLLGVSTEQGESIDKYQNIGRFLYRYAGDFLEEATILCFEHRFPHAKRKVKISNGISSSPKKFEIDCLVDNYAIEIKWRDATTDGNHVNKENDRIKAIKQSGYIPIRIMFYYPNRENSINIQKKLELDYHNIGGQYYYGDAAWSYLTGFTGIDLKDILVRINLEK